MGRRRRGDAPGGEAACVPHPGDLPLRFRTELASTVPAIGRAVKRVAEVLAEMGCTRSERLDVEIALREALVNAVVHGNGSDPVKKVALRCRCHPERGLLLTVRDQGAGFDPAEVPDPRVAERVSLDHGRGIFLMRELMDHIEHRKGGREVVLFFKKRSAARRPPRS